MKSSYLVICATFAAASFTSSVQAEAILHALTGNMHMSLRMQHRSPPQVIKKC